MVRPFQRLAGQTFFFKKNIQIAQVLLLYQIIIFKATLVGIKALTS